MKILNPELPDASLPLLKNVRLDVLAELPGNLFINIEMQVGAQWYFASRALFYWSKIYAGSLGTGGEYSELLPVYGIYILDFECFASDDKPMHSFVLKESESSEKLFKNTEMMKLIFIELPKFKDLENMPKNKELQSQPQSQLARRSNLDLWLTFLKTVSDQQMGELKMTDPNLAQAVSEVELAAMKPEERRRYFSHIEGLKDYRSDLYASALQGKAEGKAEGIAEA